MIAALKWANAVVHCEHMRLYLNGCSIIYHWYNRIVNRHHRTDAEIRMPWSIVCVRCVCIVTNTNIWIKSKWAYGPYAAQHMTKKYEILSFNVWCTHTEHFMDGGRDSSRHTIWSYLRFMLFVWLYYIVHSSVWRSHLLPLTIAVDELILTIRLLCFIRDLIYLSNSLYFALVSHSPVCRVCRDNYSTWGIRQRCTPDTERINPEMPKLKIVRAVLTADDGIS